MTLKLYYRPQIVKAIQVCLMALSCALSVSAQEIIRNPAKPASKRPARPLELEEVLRIKDSGDEFYFRGSPGGLTSLGMDASGHIYAQSGIDQILRFTSDGNFIGNIVRGGQGPGEVSQYFSFQVGDNDVFVIDHGQQRIIRLAPDGKLINQWKPLRAYKDFIGVSKDRLVFSCWNFPSMDKRTGKLMDVPYEILSVAFDGSDERTVHTYPVLRFLDQKFIAYWAPFSAALSDDGRYLFVNHTDEYGISMLDLSTGKIVRSFQRKYKRIEHAPLKGEAEIKKKYNYKRSFDSDIEDLYVFGDRLWVKTSTEDKQKAALYDVYSFDGVYRDSFFLKTYVFSIRRGCLLTWDADEEGLQCIVVYKPK